jgi:hypothetical protein
MLNKADSFEEIPELYKIIPLNIFRHTTGVSFDNVPLDCLPRIDAIDRVIHKSSSTSPGPVGDIIRPWYMHSHQDDNLVVLHGTRLVDIYTKDHNQVENFEVTPDRIIKNGVTVFEGPAMLVWPRHVFHRVESREEGSSAINFAVHYEGISMMDNFNIYDLDTETGHFKMIRAGFEDQQPG